jgi:tRNA(Ile)-lysidine synthase
MFSALHSFLLHHYDPEKPLLLGFSGGPDSLALLHLLLAFRKEHPLNLHLAHVDHGWRSESGEEADQLQQEAIRLGLPFHLKRLSPSHFSGNLEAACRRERRRFFRELTLEHRFQAVLLAHHSDDQAETVLKFILEGRELPFLGGIAAVASEEELTLWRPLLSTTKKEIEQYLARLALSPIRDSTNLDPRFLRGRFRTAIIPQLSETFGKEVSGSLCRLGEEAQQLRSYLEEKIAPCLAKAVEGVQGLQLDLSPFMPMARLELKLVIRTLAERQGIFLSRESIATAIELVEKRAANRQINQSLQVDRQRLLFLL